MPIEVREGKKRRTYRVRNRGVDGAWVTETFRTRTEALRYDADCRQRRYQGTLFGGLRRTSLADYFAEWAATARSRASNSWRRRQRVLFEQYIAPVIGSLPTLEVRSDHLQEVLNRMHDAGLSAASQYHAYSLIHVMYARLHETTGVLNPATTDLRPQVPVKEARHLTPEQLGRLVSHAKGKRYDVAIWLGAFLGLRIGEIQGVKREDLELSGGWIAVRRSYNNKDRVFREFPKGRKQRTLPIPAECLDFLRERVGSLPPEAAVAAAPGWAMLGYWDFMDSLKQYCLELEIPVIPSHGLRHSAGGVYLAHGAGRGEVQQLLGHESASTTERYLHGRGTGVDEVARKIRLIPKDPKLEGEVKTGA